MIIKDEKRLGFYLLISIWHLTFSTQANIILENTITIIFNYNNSIIAKIWQKHGIHNMVCRLRLVEHNHALCPLSRNY